MTQSNLFLLWVGGRERALVKARSPIYFMNPYSNRERCCTTGTSCNRPEGHYDVCITKCSGWGLASIGLVTSDSKGRDSKEVVEDEETFMPFILQALLVMII